MEEVDDACGPLEAGTVVPVVVRSVSNGVDERKVLVVRTDMLPADSRGAARRLVVLLTDPVDLTFLYTLVLPEHEFLALKREQNLTVDFGGFPDELQALLRDAASDEPSFIVELGIVEATGRAMLSICKPERIKPVNYLSVGFVRANEKALVEHLAARLQQYIAAKLRLSHIVTELQPRIHSQREELAAAAAEHERETTALRLQYEREQAAVAERHHAAVDDLTRLHSEGVAQLQAQLQSNAASSRASMDAAQQRERELSAALAATEAKLADTASRLGKALDTAAALESSERRVQEANRGLDAANHELRTELNKRDTTIAALTERVEYLGRALASAQALAESTKSEKAVFEAAVAELRPRCVALEDSVNKTAAQLRRRDDKIKKLSTAVQRKNAVLREQERLLRGLESEVTRISREKDHEHNANESLTQKLAVSEQKLGEAKSQLQRQEERWEAFNKMQTERKVAEKATRASTVSGLLDVTRQAGGSPTPLPMSASASRAGGYTVGTGASAVAGVSGAGASSGGGSSGGMGMGSGVGMGMGMTGMGTGMGTGTGGGNMYAFRPSGEPTLMRAIEAHGSGSPSALASPAVAASQRASDMQALAGGFVSPPQRAAAGKARVELSAVGQVTLTRGVGGDAAVARSSYFDHPSGPAPPTVLNVKKPEVATDRALPVV